MARRLLVLATFAPWSAVGALGHGLVLTLVIVPTVLVVLQPPPAAGLLLAGGTFAGTTAVVYRLFAPGGVRPLRVKLMTGVAICSAFIGSACATGVAYTWLRQGDALSPLVSLALGFVGLLSLLFAAGASLDAIATGWAAE